MNKFGGKVVDALPGSAGYKGSTKYSKCTRYNKIYQKNTTKYAGYTIKICYLTLNSTDSTESRL